MHEISPLAEHPKPALEAKPSLRIGILALPDFTLLSLSCFIDFLRLSADERDYGRQIYCTWDMLSHNAEPITSSCGIPLIPGRLLGNPCDYDFIVVHGGILHGNTSTPEPYRHFIQQAMALGVRIVGLCTGQFLLAEMGLLDGLHCAVHFSLTEQLQEGYPHIIPVSDKAVVQDGSFITCPGGLAAINLAAFLVTEKCGRIRADKTLHYLMAGQDFDALKVEPQYAELGLKCPDQRVVNAVGLMLQRIQESGTIASIARSIGVTERELSRLFNQHLKTSPAMYWRLIRLKAAHWQVLNSTRSVTQIAYECGFTDSSHLIYWFKRRWKITPAQLRKIRKKAGVH